jgi:hypothetical protein
MIYALIQYGDYCKGTTIRLHGYTLDKDKAIEKIVYLANTTSFYTPGEFRIVKEISNNNNDNEYVCLMYTGKSRVICQYTASIIDFSSFNEFNIDPDIVKPYLGVFNSDSITIEMIVKASEELMLSTEQLDQMFRQLNIGLTCEIFAVVELDALL